MNSEQKTPGMTPPPKIIHMDMDAFYAAVEQRDFPEYRGKPLIVGGDPDRRGVVATCSYEARRFGIHSAMAAAHARQLCPQVIFVRPRFAVYRQVSRAIHAILRRYTDVIEPLSLDEAYLDVTGATLFGGSATRIATDIKSVVREETGLTASAGVSYNKFLAKLASDFDKPDGLYVITPAQGPGFVASLPIGRFHGIGKATEAKMKALGIHTGADLKGCSRERLRQTFGKAGVHYYDLARGIDKRLVVSHRTRKSLGAETTFAEDLEDIGEMLVKLRKLAAEVAGALASRRLVCHTLAIKVKYANFEQVTRSQTVDNPLQGVEEMGLLLPGLLAKTEAGRRKVRLLGVTASTLEDASGGTQQLDLVF
jgi:DNA polymerase-4